jgi:hypothetical protein
MSRKNRGYHNQAIKRYYGGGLRGLAHTQLFRQRGLRPEWMACAVFSAAFVCVVPLLEGRTEGTR